MKYRFYGDELQLIRYELTIKKSMGDATYDEIIVAVLIGRYPDAAVAAVDNSGFEWLDGMTFTQEQLRAGELEQAIEMGEDAYTEIRNAPTQEQINAMLMLEIARIKAGVVNE